MKEQGPGVRDVAVATDATNGPLLAIVDATGTVYAKQGSLRAGWVKEQGPGVWEVAVATDPKTGPLVAIRRSADYWAKSGSLNAGWVVLNGPP